LPVTLQRFAKGNRVFDYHVDLLLDLFLLSFPRSAWERTVDALRPLWYDRGTRPSHRSHAEHGNEEYHPIQLVEALCFSLKTSVSGCVCPWQIIPFVFHQGNSGSLSSGLMV